MDPTQLPDDPEALKRLLLEMQARVELAEGRAVEAEERATSAEQDRASLASQLAETREELAALKRRHFGRRTERVSSKQLSLLHEDTAPADALAAAKAAEEGQAGQASSTPPKRKRRRSKHGRRRLPSHLPREPVTSADPGPTTCPCCAGELKVIGTDVSERLEFIPGHFVALEVTRTKRACPRCPSAGVFVQPAPAFALDRALPADGLLARIITDKFADHLPLTRQAKRMKREGGVDIPVSTMCGWLKASAGLLKHVVDQIRRELKQGTVVQSDATGLPILEGDKNNPVRGTLWAYTDGCQVVYEATRDGTQQHPARHLEGFTGTLVSDGTNIYDLLARHNDITRAGCWAHVRRKFFDARNEEPVRAGIAMAYCRDVFALERELVQLEPEQRARKRKETLGPRLEAFKTWMDTHRPSVRPKSALGKALTYALNQWDTLLVYLEDGRVPPHNNVTERQLRGPVVGRKNWMFAGSIGGAQTAATNFSIVGSCVLAGIDPYEYLRDVMSLLPDATPSEVAKLTPRAWAERFGQKTPS